MKKTVFSGLCLCLILTSCKPVWENLNLSFSQRTAQLVAEITLEEKVFQVSHQALAIERLGISEHRDRKKVVQLYVFPPHTFHPVPTKSLQRFEKIFLKVGESRLISFNLDLEQRSAKDENGVWIAEQGEVVLEVGGQQYIFNHFYNGEEV